VHERLLQQRDPEQVNVILRKVEKAELDEIWGFVIRARTLCTAYRYALQDLPKKAMSSFLRGLCMIRGRKTSLTVRLTAAERQTLLAWQRAVTLPSGLARRGRIILLLAEGVTITDIATTVGISRRFVYKWVQRFLQEGLEGLIDRPGRRRQLRPSQHDLRERYDADVG
jgi:CRP-like cAMP-binding protein